MSINSLSLAHPSDVSSTWQPRSPHGPPPGYVPRSPVGPPPSALPHVRAPRRCSLCRQPGHNKNSCHTARVISQRQQLKSIVTSFLEVAYPSGTSMRPEPQAALVRFLDSLSSVQVEEAIISPALIINYPLFHQVVRIIHRILHPVTILGKNHAKKIALILEPYKEEKLECFICCEESCSLKASCGHEFCGNCVSSIIDTSKNTTSPPLCSYCRDPFTSLAVSDHFVYVTLADFIEKL